MKVVHLTTVAISLRFVTGHVRLLREQQVEVHAISSPSEELDNFTRRSDVIAHGIEMQRQISPWRDLVSLWKLVKQLQAIRPEIVHAHTPKAGLLGMLAASLIRVPVKVYHLHGLPLMTASGLKRRLLRLCDKIACRLADKVYSVSPSLCEVVHEEGICDASRLSVLEQGSIGGIDAVGEFNPANYAPNEAERIRSELGIPNSAKVIGFVGRVVRDKGIHELLAAWQQLQNEFEDLRLLIVGPLESGNAISENARELLQEDPKIHCVGMQQETARYYLAMDVLAFPTYREGFGLVATEASAMERAVVAPRISGCVDAVADGRTGTLIQPQDVESLVQSLRDYLSDPELASCHGQAGRRRVLEEFQPQKIEQALWREYCELLRAKGLPLPQQEETPRQQSAVAA